MTKWTEGEEEYLVNHWEDMALRKLADSDELEERSTNAIRKKAKRMGLPKKSSIPQGGKKWTEEEVDYLKEKYPMSPRDELEEELDRSWSSIKSKAHSLGLSRISIEENEVDEAEYKFSVVHHDIEIDGSKMHIIPLGDIHYGHPACRFDKVKSLLNRLENKDNHDYRLVLTGDLWEGQTKHSPNSTFEAEYSPQQQYEHILSFFNQYKDKILGAVVGNHEQFATRVSGFTKMKDFCRELKVPFLKYKGIIDLNLNGVYYRIFVQHGSTSSRTLGGKMNALYRMNEVVPDADIYLHAHTHTRMTGSDSQFSSVGDNVKKKDRLYALTGSFLDYSGTYADMKSYPPSSLGVIKVTLYADGKEKRVTV